MGSAERIEQWRDWHDTEPKCRGDRKKGVVAQCTVGKSDLAPFKIFENDTFLPIK